MLIINITNDDVRGGNPRPKETTAEAALVSPLQATLG